MVIAIVFFLTGISPLGVLEDAAGALGVKVSRGATGIGPDAASGAGGVGAGTSGAFERGAGALGR